MSLAGLVNFVLYQSLRKISFPGLSRFIFFSSHKSWPPNIVGLAWVNTMCGGYSNSINAVSYAKKYELHCFCLTMSWDPLEYIRQSQPIRGKRSTSQDLIADIFPRSRQIICFDFAFPLVHVIFPYLWLAVVITICLDLRHSIEILPKVARALAFYQPKWRWLGHAQT